MFKVHLRRTLIFLVIAGFLGWFVGSRMPKIYEAVVEIQVGSPNVGMDNSLPTEVKRQLLPSLFSDLDSDIGVLKSNRVFRDGLSRASQALSRSELATSETFLDLFPMYDVEVPGAINSYAPDQTRVVKIRVRAYEGEAAAEIANQIGYAFSDLRRQRTRTALSDTLKALEAQAKAAKTELTRIDKEYENLKVKQKTADFTEKNRIMATIVEQLKDKRDQTDVELESTRGAIISLQRQILELPVYVAGSEVTQADPRRDLLKQQLAAAEQELDTVRQQFTNDSVQVKQALERVASVKARLADAMRSKERVDGGSTRNPNPLREELRGRLSSLIADQKRLESAVIGYSEKVAGREAELMALPGAEVKAQQLLRDRSVAEEKYIKSSGFITEFSNVIEGRSVPIISPAVPELSKVPVAPDVKRWVILMALAGGLLGLAYSFAVESFRLPVHTSWQLSELTALPVAASVPALPKPLQRRHTSELVQSSFRPIESFRFMAFSTLAKEHRPKVMMFTAVGADVEAAPSAAEFAVAVARTGAKTILVDCDLRIATVSKIFGAEGRTGVSDILGRTVLPGESSEIYVSTQHENLLLLPAGSNSNSGLLDFATTHVQALFDQLRDQADMVVISCPPVDVFSDAARMASFVEETALVISAKTTSYRAIPIAQEILSKSGAKSVSIVLVNASSSDEPFGARMSDIAQQA